MTEESGIPEELSQVLGKEKVTTADIERGMIQRYVEAVEDYNPLYCDDKKAATGPNKGIVVPPGFLTTVYMSGRSRQPDLPDPLPRLLDGGGEWEFFQPVRPGDVITITCKFADIKTRAGRLGKMLIWTFQWSFVNQKKELVSRASTTRITY